MMADIYSTHLETGPTLWIRKVRKAGTLADAFRDFGVSQEQMEKFAFLNNMELSDHVPAGKLIKIATE
ncbi:MAG: hypothetical protein R6U58_03465 [Bacteroidales bacterium]